MWLHGQQSCAPEAAGQSLQPNRKRPLLGMQAGRAVTQLHKWAGMFRHELAGGVVCPMTWEVLLWFLGDVLAASQAEHEARASQPRYKGKPV